MSVKRLMAIIFIFVCTFVAWMILGAANLHRTSENFDTLKKSVEALYGNALEIPAPTLSKRVPRIRKEIVDGQERIYHEGTTDVPMSMSSQKVRIRLNLDQRKKGNLWFPTFRTFYEGDYEFEIPADANTETLYFQAPLKSSNSIYSNIHLSIQGQKNLDISSLATGNAIPLSANGQKTIKVSIRYDATGMEQLLYSISPEYDSISQIRELDLEIRTDFDNFDFLENTLSPTSKKKLDKGHLLTWTLKDSVTGKDVGVIIPNKLNPGDILSRVTFFAPVPLLFFFFIVLMVSTIRHIPIHPMHYFFLAATFFSFHLIYSYYSDLMNIYLAFGIAGGISLILTATYLRLFTPKSFAFVIAPLAQLIYLLVFSFSFFFKGTTGVIVSTFSVVTLFAMMQLTGRMDWEQVFQNKSAKDAAGKT